MEGLGVYIHIPFCIKKCNYCDFCSFAGQGDAMFEAYTDELCRRMRVFSKKYGKRNADTVYFGGGTPTLLPLACFDRLMTTLKECFEIETDAEITVECNPASIDEQGLRQLRALGTNRISIGLQSANEKELELLGRPHSFVDFCVAFESARRVGFDNISLDIMYGIPEQTLESFEQTLNEACALSPEHISAYGLKIEEGTAFARNRETLILPDEDIEYQMYCLCNEILSRHGYNRYEISNFAKVGRESRHNLKYWLLEDYIGFGVAAHSCFSGERFGNSRDIKAFLAGEDIVEERTLISSDEQATEYVMLGLRLDRGIDLLDYERRFGRAFENDFREIDAFLKGGFMTKDNGRIAFTTKGFFVSNTILAQMLSFD